MIDSTLEFQTADLPYVIRAFCELPEKLRPTHYSFGEDEPDKLLLDVDNFPESLVDSGMGPMLKGSNVEYVIEFYYDRIGGKPVKKIICFCDLKVRSALAQLFLVCMAKAQPLFGYACSEKERHHRNRIVVQQNKITIESWVGRDLRKYVSGFYWLTLLSDVLVERHDIPLLEVKKIALDHKELEGGQHLFRFYERPEDWKSTDDVSKLCTLLPNVFNVDKVRSHVMAAKNYREVKSVLREWG